MLIRITSLDALKEEGSSRWYAQHLGKIVEVSDKPTPRHPNGDDPCYRVTAEVAHLLGVEDTLRRGDFHYGIFKTDATIVEEPEQIGTLSLDELGNP